MAGLRKFRIAVLLIGLHAFLIFTVGKRSVGALSSDSVQLLVGVLVVFSCLAAGRRSPAHGRYLWRVMAISFGIWCGGQALGVGNDFVLLITGKQAPNIVSFYSSVLFELWFFPLALTLFVDPDSRFRSFDWVVVLDALQAGIVLFTAFLFFCYIPFLSRALDVELANSVRDPYFLLHAALIVAFVVRSVCDTHTGTRSFFRWVALYLTCSMGADLAYYYTPVHDLPAGTWFDLVWSSVLLIPVFAAGHWRWEDASPAARFRRSPLLRTISTQFFPLIYPLLVLGLASNLSLPHRTAASALVLLSYGCLTARLLVSHHRLAEFQVELEHRASHDALTGVLNRASILERLRVELQRAERTGLPLGLVMLDADRFKGLNDRHGHLGGDRVLEHLSLELQRSIRSYDAVGRYGGEEFLIVLPGDSLMQSLAYAERVRQSVENCSVPIYGQDVRFTVSLGVASARPGAGVDDVIRAADKALYSAKANGRNRVEVEAVSVPADAVPTEGSVSVPPGN